MQGSEGGRLGSPLYCKANRVWSTANDDQIRCSGERPICKRCLRLTHTCVYTSSADTVRNISKPAQSSTSVVTNSQPLPAPSTPREGRHATSKETLHGSSRLLSPPSPELDDPAVKHYLGIPESLVLTLVEVYYDNVYNASLLLHKQTFLDSLAAGTARPHLVLGVCAWAAKYTTKDSRFQGDS